MTAAQHALYTTPPEQIARDLVWLGGGRAEAVSAALQVAALPAAPVAMAIDPQLAAFYQVSSVAELLAAQEEHIQKLQDSARRNVKPWEDTFPPTLLPKYLRDTGLAQTAQSALPAVPEGWVLVPRVPTEAMLQAADDAVRAAEIHTPNGTLVREPTRIRYAAMLAAAPAHDQPEGSDND